MFAGYTSHKKTDKIPLIRIYWYMFFGDVDAIKKATVKHGWGPYNRALILHHVI